MGSETVLRSHFGALPTIFCQVEEEDGERLVESQPASKKHRYDKTTSCGSGRGKVSYSPPAAAERTVGRTTEEPSSSQTSTGEPEPAELASLQARLREREVELQSQRRESERFLKELQESVECPVCFR